MFWLVTFLLLIVSTYADRLGRLMHVTDVHYDPYYRPGTWAECWRGDTVNYPCCHTWEVQEGPRKAGRLGDYNCDSPISLIDDTFDFITQLNPELVIWTGDNPGNNVLSQTPWQNLEAIELIAQKFANETNATVFPTYGNHDTYPADQIMDPPMWEWLFNRVAEYWSPWIRGKAQDTLKYGGYYSQIVTHGLRLISLNTLYYDSHNLFDVGVDPAEQWVWFEKTLSNARQEREKVWIIGHIYPGASEAKDFFSVEYNRVVSKYRDIIVGQFFGHSHKDEFKMTRDNVTDKATSVLYIAPSVTPMSIMNPSVRVYYYNMTTFEIVDYEQYNANLTWANQAGRLNFTLEYAAREVYKLPDLSVGSWINLVNRFIDDDKLFQVWYKYYHGSALDTECDAHCKQEHVCSMLYSTRAATESCKVDILKIG